MIDTQLPHTLRGVRNFFMAGVGKKMHAELSARTCPYLTRFVRRLWYDAGILMDEGVRVEVLYLDSLFVLNALMDYFLLLASARMAGEKLYRGRMAAAGIFGGGYAVATVLPGGAFLLHPVCKLGSAILMVLIGLGGSQRLLRQSMIFLFLACALGGGVLAIGLLRGGGFPIPGGVLRTDMDLKTVLLSAGLCYAFIALVGRRMGTHGGHRGELVKLTLEKGGRQINFTGLVDTGNTLTDPMDGRSVIVVDWDRMKELLPGFLYQYAAAPIDGLERMNRGEEQGCYRLLSYRAVGVECGMLLAVRLDRAWVNGRGVERPLVAISPTAVSDGGGYHALVGRMD